jgi:hypothetical protein
MEGNITPAPALKANQSKTNDFRPRGFYSDLILDYATGFPSEYVA